MDITEQWIGKAAGGRIFKEARVLLKMRKVIQVTRKDGVFQGTLDIGKRPMRVAVKVLGPNEVHNHCGCAMSRRTGALCEHATALMLASVLPPERMPGAAAVKSSELKEARETKVSAHVEPVPLEIRLSPKFPHEGVQAAHLRKLDIDETTAADQVLTAWLIDNTGHAADAMLSLPKDKLSGFYRALSGHSRVSRGDQRMDIFTSRLRPAIEMKIEGALASLRMLGGNLISLGNALAEWDEEGARLVVDQSDSEGVSMQGWQEMKTQGVIKMLPALAEMYQLPEDLGGLDIRAGVPEIELEIAGSTRALQAQLVAKYPSDVRVPLAIFKAGADTGFPIASLEKENQWWVRNPDLEQAAIGRMIEVGFQVLDSSGMLFLRGEDEVLDFLTTMLPLLRKRWTVHTEEKLGRVESRVERIIPKIDIQGSCEDWLSCEVAWQCGEHSLDSAAVRKLLMSGGRSMALPRGGKAVLSHFDAEVMEGFLLDTDPQQENGAYRFPAQQAAYLKGLRQYYASDASDEAEVQEHEPPVPALPDDLTEILRDYQLEGVNWLYRRMCQEGAALLADDMGLGKTLQTLACLKLWKQNQSKAPALVVCPATLLGNWRDEAAKFVPDLTVLVMHGLKRKDYFDVMEVADIIITSYALLDRDCEQYQNIQLGMLILDEASAIRNPDTLAAKAARRVKAPARIAITGTPVENGVRDLWSIFQFLMPSYLGGREDFRLRYELPCQAEVPDRAAMQRLRWRTAPFMLRRTKSLVAKDLPPKLESIVWCDPSPMQKDQYQSILRHGVETVEALRKQGGPDAGRMQMLTVLLRLRQSCCDLRLLNDELGKVSLSEVSAKLARLMELLDEAQRGGHRVLVFSQFTSMLSLIRDELDKEDIDFCYLDGGTRDRSAVVDRFQKPNGPPVFLISLKAGGYGLTLTAADTVVLFDPWWNPAVEAQAADRIHRIGQTKPATIYKLITRGTVEEKILRLQDRKRSVISAAMGEISDEATPMMTGLTEGEMLELLQ